MHENGDDSASVTSADHFSVTSAGQFERGDLSATRDVAIPEKVSCSGLLGQLMVTLLNYLHKSGIRKVDLVVSMARFLLSLFL